MCCGVFQAGPSGAHFGVLGCLLVEEVSHLDTSQDQNGNEDGDSGGNEEGDAPQQSRRGSILAVVTLVVPIVILFLLGLMLPWLDNFAHFAGLLFGMLLSVAFLPYVHCGQTRWWKVVTFAVAGGLAVLFFVVLVIIFYVVPLTDCKACQYFNCIPFTADFCENMEVSLKKNSTYSSYY
jgi:hypothetical protein